MWTQRPVSTLTPWTISLFRLTNQLLFNTHCLLFQDCEIKPCPTCSYPGLWVQPMLDLEGAKELQTYILKANPTIPTEPQKNWTFRKFGPKMDKNDPKWPKVAQNGQRMTQNSPKMTRTFSVICFDWKGGSQNFFAFKMYGFKGEPHNCPPQNCPLRGQSWGGQFWVHQSSELPTPTNIVFLYDLCFKWSLGECSVK